MPSAVVSRHVAPAADGWNVQRLELTEQSGIPGLERTGHLSPHLFMRGTALS